VPGGLPTEALIAQIIVVKLGDHLPFYRQAKIYASEGILLDRASFGNWVGRACFHLRPVGDHMHGQLAHADRLFMDETTAPVLDPGRRQVKKGYFWARLVMIAAMAAQAHLSSCSSMPPGAAAILPKSS